MWRLALLFALVLTGLVASQGVSTPLAPGKNLPGTFHPFNVTEVILTSEEPEEVKGTAKKKVTYTSKGKFHCLINEYNLDPVVMIIKRGIDDNGLIDLLKKLDAAIDRNRKGIRLKAFVVFLDDDLMDVVEEDEKREKAVTAIEDLVRDSKLTNMVMSLGCKKDLAKYDLDDSAMTAVLYHKLKIVSAHRLKEITAATTKPILDDVSSKLGAK